MKVYLGKNFKSNFYQIYFRLHRDYSSLYYINGIDVTTNIEDSFDFAHIIDVSQRKEINYVKDKLKKKVVVNYFVNKKLSKAQNVTDIVIPFEDRRILNKCDLVIVSCQADRMILAANEIKTPIEIITPPVKEERFTKVSELEKNAFFQYGGLVKTDQFALANVSYKHEQDVIDLIDLANELKNYRFFVFGPRITMSTLKKIKKLIKSAPENIKFKTYVNEDLFKSAMLLANFYIVTREAEGELIHILEAMITKTQIFMYHTHLTGDVLNDNVNCIHAINSKDMAEKIQSFIDKKDSTIQEAYEFAKECNYENCSLILKRILENYIDLEYIQA